jgi:hypothetical protein
MHLPFGGVIQNKTLTYTINMTLLFNAGSYSPRTFIYSSPAPSAPPAPASYSKPSPLSLSSGVQSRPSTSQRRTPTTHSTPTPGEDDIVEEILKGHAENGDLRREIPNISEALYD